jgi:hypothetical protein
VLPVTVDTNIDPADRTQMGDACREGGVDAELVHTSVTDRERNAPVTRQVVYETGVYDESRYDLALFAADSVGETLVLDESPLGVGVLGGDDSQSRMDEILRILSHGSFPPVGKRENLSAGARRQLRDAMILEAHCREGRDVFVTNDGDFIEHGRRDALEALCETRIMTVAEFCDYVTNEAA